MASGICGETGRVAPVAQEEYRTILVDECQELCDSPYSPDLIPTMLCDRAFVYQAAIGSDAPIVCQRYLLL